MTRPVAAVEAEIARLHTTRKVAPCDETTAPGFGPLSRRVCAQIAGLTAEAATTARRVELQAALAAAEADLAAAPLATPDADPAAAALAVYLAAVGVPGDAGTLSKWLVLVPVLALEVGSALAVMLVGGTPAGRERSQTVPVSNGIPIRADLEVGGTIPTPDASTPRSSTPVTLTTALLEHLTAHGGSLRTGQRSLARALGTSTTELHRALHALAAAGVISLNTAPTGTELRIAS